MKILPTLEETILNQAKANLNRDIKDASDNLSNFLASQKGLFRTGMSIVLMTEDDKKIYPYLSQLFDCDVIKNKIIEYNLSDYVQREIDLILKPNK